MKKIIFTLIIFTLCLFTNYAFADATLSAEVKMERTATVLFMGFMAVSIFVYYLVWNHKHKNMIARRTMAMGQGRKQVIERKAEMKRAA